MPQYFDWKAAKEQGHNDDQVLSHLIKKNEVAGKKFDLEQALKDGHTKQSLIEHLSGFKPPEKLENDIPKWGQESPNLYKAFQTGKELTRPVVEGSGMGAGAALGAPLGPAGSFAGGVLGYMISKKSMDMVDRQINVLEKNKLPPTNLQKESLQSLQDLKDGLTYEMFGRNVGKAAPAIAGKIIAPFQNKMTPAVKFVQNEAKNAGITLTPADLTGHKGIGLAESLMEKVWGATDIIRDFRLNSQINPLEARLNTLLKEGASKESVESTGQKIWDEVTDYLTTQKRLEGDLLNGVRTKMIAKLGNNQSFSAIGLEAKEVIKARTQLMRDRKNELYNAIGELTPEGGFETPNLAAEAKAILKERKGLPASSMDSELRTWLGWAKKEMDISPQLQKTLEGVPANVRESILKDLGDEIKVKRTWNTLQEATKDMEAIMRQDDPMRYTGLKGGMSPKGRTAVRLKSAMQKDMRAMAESNPDALEQLKIADAFYGDYADVVKSKMVKNLINADSGKLIDVAFRPNAIDEIKLLKAAAGPNGFLKLREGFMNKLLGTNKDVVFKPETFRNNIIKYGDETLTEIFGKSDLVELKKIAKEGLDLTVHAPNRNFLKSVTETDPDFIVDKLIGAPESKLQSNILARNLKAIQKTVSEKTFTELGDNLAEKLIVRSQSTDLVRPQGFVKMVDKYNERVLKKFFPYEKVEGLKKLADVARHLQKAEDIAGNPSGTGQTLIAWGMFRMIMTNLKTGAVISFTPKQLAKLYTSKFGIKYLTDGFNLPVGSKTAATHFSRISAIIADEKLQENNNDNQ